MPKYCGLSQSRPTICHCYFEPSWRTPLASVPCGKPLNCGSSPAEYKRYIIGAMADASNYQFRCPSCEAEYKVVRIEAAATHSNQLTCLSCGGPLNNREGK